MKYRLTSAIEAVTVAIAVLVMAGPVPSKAQEFPNRPVKIVVAYPAGSVNDVYARALSEGMSSFLKVPVIVENRAGAGGVIGTEAVVKSPADGYTVGFGTSSQLVMNPGTHSLNFDIDKDMSLIGLVATQPLAIVFSSALPPTLKEFIAAAKANPGKYTFASAGQGSISHILAEAMMQQAGIKLQHIPFQGQAPALSNVAGGHVDVLFDSVIVAAAMAQKGQVRVVAIGELPGAPGRSAGHPDIPTFAEAGLPALDGYTWSSLFVPSKLDPKVTAKLNAALGAGLITERMKGVIAQAAGRQLGPSTPEAADKFGGEQRARWVPFIQSLKLSQ